MYPNILLPKVEENGKNISSPGKPKTKPHNYKPISLLNTLSKVLEKIIHIQLTSYLKKHDIIIPQQFGFRKKHSCIQQLQRVIEYATLELNKKRITQLVLLDLEKAFDTVCHEALLQKLHNIHLHT